MIDTPVGESADRQIAGLQDQIKRLQRAVEELSVLNDLARAIGASSNSEEVIGIITRRSLKAVNAEQGVITLTNEQAMDTSKTLIRTVEQGSSSSVELLHLNDALLGWMHINKKPLMLNTPRTDPRFQGIRWDESIRTVLCVPLIVKSELRGVLAVYNKKAEGGFTPEDQRLLGIICAQSAQIIENARLLEQERSLIAMQEEVRVAATIQHQLLPKSSPQIAGYEIYGRSISARTVGGDYFDYMEVDSSHFAFCVGDVTGKGLPASLLMANVQATLRGQTLLKLPPAECLANSNKLLYQSTTADKFVTLFYGILDFTTHELVFSNAGHDYPLIISSDGTLRQLKTGGLMLGAIDGMKYDHETVSLQPGDTLLVYSDGIPEAMNPNGEFFGVERVESILRERTTQSAREISDAFVDAVKKYADTAPQSDDITIMVIKRLA